MSVYSREEEYPARHPSAFKPVENPRQILLLILKSYYFVTDEYIARAAPAIGMREETLSGLIEALRKLRFDREEDMRNLQNRIYGQYYRCITLEKRMNGASDESGRYIAMKIRLERSQKRLRAMKKRLQNIRPGASNRQIALVLGIPKGTVDSNLSAIKINHREAWDDGNLDMLGPVKK
jgi:hypothetical protein